MTLLFECPNCQFKHDAKLSMGQPNLIECPNCNEKYRIDLTVKKLKGEKYYESNSKE